MYRRITLSILLPLILGITAVAKDKPRLYQTGKLLDVSVETVSRGTAIIAGLAAPIPGRLYQFEIESGDLVYFAEYSAGKLSYQPQWVVKDPIEFRLQDTRMFLKRPDGKELEVALMKRVRAAGVQK